MSLTGRLEDLGLGDILQIVSLSRKSGILSLTYSERKGEIIFKNGQIVRAIANYFYDDYTKILIEKKFLTAEEVSRIKLEAKSYDDSLKQVSKTAKKEIEEVEDLIRSELEKRVISFFGWKGGIFSFELKDIENELAALEKNIFSINYPYGVNPQFLAMEGTKLLDEGFFQDESIFKPLPEEKEVYAPKEVKLEVPSAVPLPEPVEIKKPAEVKKVLIKPETDRFLLVVDDDEALGGIMKEFLEENNLSSTVVSNSLIAAKLAKDAFLKEKEIILVCDLIMPRLDGQGILGGIELVENLKKDNISFKFIIISDYTHSEAFAKAKNFGVVTIITKPKASQVADKDEKALNQFLNQLKSELYNLLPKGLPEKPKLVSFEKARNHKLEMESFREEIDRELEGAKFLEEAKGKEVVPVSKGLSMLKLMIYELSQPLSSGEIALLILRFASEIFNRAVLFALKKDFFTGVGQFGVEVEGEHADKRVRKIRIPVYEESIFQKAYQLQGAVKEKIKETPWNRYFIEQLGGEKPLEAFAVPITSGGKVSAILYGDNLPNLKEIGETESLEIFLTQAGIALEKAILEKKIKELGV